MKRQAKKEARALQILLRLVELYIETNRPIGSHTLKEQGLEAFSSATLRNYCAELEEEGYLYQPHPSGGRIPTEKAFRWYASTLLEDPSLFEAPRAWSDLEMESPAHLARFLQQAAERLSQETGCAVFLSSLRFDQDFILEVKLVDIDPHRLLCVMVTNFGYILTEVLLLEKKWSAFSLKRMESYIQWRIKGGHPPEGLTPDEEAEAQRHYNEILVRYLVRYSNFSQEELYRTNFSTLLAYPEFKDPIALTTALSLFENPTQMRRLLEDALQRGKVHYWIGEDLSPYVTATQPCTILTAPYSLGPTRAGAIALLGPCRLPYRPLFATLHAFAAALSTSLTQSLFKFKISFRQPHNSSPYLVGEERVKKLIKNSPTERLLLIEEKSRHPSTQETKSPPPEGAERV